MTRDRKCDLGVGAVLQDDKAVDRGQGMKGLVGPFGQLLLPFLCSLWPQIVQVLPLCLVHCLQTMPDASSLCSAQCVRICCIAQRECSTK